MDSGNFNAFPERGFKIIQSFVNEKIIVSMASSIHKWLLVPGLLLLAGWRGSGPANSAKKAHPYYISVVEINHDANAKILEISCKIFTNDFETTLEKNYKSKIDLSNPKDKPSADRTISDYVKKHLSIKADGRPADFSYLGFEKQDEAVFSYFQADNIATVKKIDVYNSLLHDFSELQINIIHCTVGGKRQSTKLGYPNSNASFSW